MRLGIHKYIGLTGPFIWCGQVQLGMLKVIPIMKSIICQDLTELWCLFFLMCVGNYSKLIKLFQLI